MTIKTFNNVRPGDIVTNLADIPVKIVAMTFYRDEVYGELTIDFEVKPADEPGDIFPAKRIPAYWTTPVRRPRHPDKYSVL